MKKNNDTSPKSKEPVLPPVWTEEQVRADANEARAALVLRRSTAIKNELSSLKNAFPVNVSAINDALDCLISCRTDKFDSEACRRHLVALIAKDPGGLKKEALRYLAYPPISEDDLESTAEIISYTKKTIEAKPDPKNPDESPDPNAAKRIMETIGEAMDPVRWGWLLEPDVFGKAEDKEAFAAAREFGVESTAMLLSSQKTQSGRRSNEKAELESQVLDILKGQNFEELTKKTIRTSSELHSFLQPGQFMKECTVISENADFVVRLKDGRFLFIECKASNSEINSRKRLNKEATKNIKVWRDAIGNSIVGACSIRGIFKPDYVLDAQRQGVYIFWAHKLDVLANFLKAAV